jgi:AraC-like DNA-binding protein
MGSPLSFRDRTGLLSQQVSGGVYFFLRLVSPRAARFALIFGGRETCHPDYVVRRSSYAYHVLEYVAEGAGHVRLDDHEAELTPGSIFAYRPETNCEIRTDPARPMLKYFLCLAGDDVPARLAHAGVAPGRVRVMAAHAEVRSLLEDMIREGRHHGRLTARLCASQLEVLLLKLEDVATRPAWRGRTAEELFLRCKAIIDARIDQPTTLKEIAAAAGIGPSSVCRLFRRFQGTSPYQYLLRRKMIVAAELLVESGKLVKETAARVGFADPYHFSRCFKAVHGASPSHLREYRRSG